MEEAYFTFAGIIDQNAARNFLAQFAAASQSGVKKAHLVVQSSGGSPQDAGFLYNHLRNLPLELVTYNQGMVASSAVVLYLAGKVRLCAPTATFCLHAASSTLANARAGSLATGSAYLSLDNARLEAALRDNLVLNESEWTTYTHHDLYLTAQEAVLRNLAHQIGQFAPPAGTQVFNIQ
jgi:ATP-dependent Clp protease protease subunit